MKILWITNNLFPEAEKLLTGKGELKGTGGWVIGAAESLLNSYSEIELHVATVSQLVKELTILSGERITYHIIPYGDGNIKYNSAYEKFWHQIAEFVHPDLVHIHGTEYSHGLAYLNACGSDKVVVSLQGIKSAIAPFYCAGLTKAQVYLNTTFRDIIRGNIYSQQRRFYQSGEIENEILRRVKHIIGRTSWDKAHAWAINPEAQYHFCNEILRPEFYDGSIWEYNKCKKHTIFLSQAGYPLKGLHQVLRAMPLILHLYPNAKIKVAGTDITRYSTLNDKLRISGYGKLIRGMIRRMHLENHIEFLGPLNASQMKEEYLRCNIFVCSSSIENSPNSLGEAQILGVPCVASYVGGIPDFMRNNEEFLYRFEEVEMLAKKICDTFADSKPNRYNSSIQIASERHNAKKNVLQLMHIYKIVY